MLIFRTENGAEVDYYATFALGDCDYIVSRVGIEEGKFVRVLESITNQ